MEVTAAAVPPDAVLFYTVAYPDTDAAGVVFHGRYLEMAERARNNVVNLAGFSYASLAQEYDTMLTVHKVEVIYHGSGVLEDRLKIQTKLTACGAARTVWLTEIERKDSLLASVRAEIVAVYASTRTVRQYPPLLLDALAPYMAQLDAAATRRSRAFSDSAAR
ncbi:MAG: hotdog domain-containing protein [Sulfurifustaceae bacterium]